MRRAGPPTLYGILAEFTSPQELFDAVLRVREEGYRDVDAYTPFPVEEISEALGHRGSRLPIIVFVGGALGAASGYFLQLWTNAIDYPLNVGGRPLNSWPMFIPITFEMTILFAVLSAVLGMFALNRLPKPYHPVFNWPRFARASRDRYFLGIQSTDPKFDRDATRAFLLSLRPYEVAEVEP
jgi:hypothetical protein